MTRSLIGEEERGLGATYNDRELQPGVPGAAEAAEAAGEVGIPSLVGWLTWRQRSNGWRRH